ncbi:hypothetical protein [Agaribacterium sp. ZY112]|uniref:hypothetical protein n=1 Tax=Agaribacterium sp. ZY112 TaxID=3233574 RepID=UPI00352382F3
MAQFCALIAQNQPTLFRPVMAALYAHLNMTFYFYLPYILIFIAIVGISSYLLSKKEKDSLAITITFLAVTIPLAALFVKYDWDMKVEFIEKSNNEAYELIGNVEELNKFNGKLIFYIDKEQFDISYSPYLCLGKKGFVEKGQRVKIKYIKMSYPKSTKSWNCVISIDYIS